MVGLSFFGHTVAANWDFSKVKGGMGCDERVLDLVTPHLTMTVPVPVLRAGGGPVGTDVLHYRFSGSTCSKTSYLVRFCYCYTSQCKLRGRYQDGRDGCYHGPPAVVLSMHVASWQVGPYPEP